MFRPDPKPTKDNPKRGHKKPHGIGKPLRKVASTIEGVEALNLTESPNLKKGGVMGSRMVNLDSPKFGHPKPLKSPKKAKKAIRKVSKVQAKEIKIYFQKRKDFLEKHTTCQAKLVGCDYKATEIHHTSKRGKNLNNEGSFLAVCRPCHVSIETVLSARERRNKGFLK